MFSIVVSYQVGKMMQRFHFASILQCAVGFSSHFVGVGPQSLMQIWPRRLGRLVDGEFCSI